MKRHNYDDGDGQSETQGGYDDGDGQSETQGDCDDANPSCAPRVAVSWTTTERVHSQSLWLGLSQATAKEHPYSTAALSLE